MVKLEVTPLPGWEWSEQTKCYFKPGERWQVTWCSPGPNHIGGWNPGLKWGVCLSLYGHMISFFATPEGAMRACDEGRAFDSPAKTKDETLLKRLKEVINSEK